MPNNIISEDLIKDWNKKNNNKKFKIEEKKPIPILEFEIKEIYRLGEFIKKKVENILYVLYEKIDNQSLSEEVSYGKRSYKKNTKPKKEKKSNKYKNQTNRKNKKNTKKK